MLDLFGSFEDVEECPASGIPCRWPGNSCILCPAHDAGWHPVMPILGTELGTHGDRGQDVRSTGSLATGHIRERPSRLPSPAPLGQAR